MRFMKPGCKSVAADGSDAHLWDSCMFYRCVFLLYRKFPYNKKHSARIALWRKRIVSLKRPAAGGESREAGFFFIYTDRLNNGVPIREIIENRKKR